MNALEEFYKELDDSNWDVKNESNINTALQKVNEILSEKGLIDVQHFAEIDRQAFHFNKSPEKRLSFRAAGTRKMEDGTEIPFEWPDIREFKENDFDYLFKRYKSCKNIYAKTEYGLVLFYSKFKQNNIFVSELLTSLFQLLKSYIEKAKIKEDKNHYILYSRIVLENALHISNNRKDNPDINNSYKSLIEYSFEVHQNWDITHSSTLRAIIDFTDFSIQYFKDYKLYVDVYKVLDKNWEAAKDITKTYVFGAIYIADVSVKLCKKLDVDTKEWFYFKAQQYEKLSSDPKNKENLASVSFVEKAMSIYKSLKDKKNLSRLQKEYQKLRTEFKLGEVRQEIPQDETRRITELIKKEVAEKSEEEIIKTLIFTPMIRPLADIKLWSEESFKQPMLMDMLPVTIQDKFGNTVAKYFSDDERKHFLLLRTYEFHLQIALQSIIHYFIEAFRSGKISSDGILNLLRQTWMGEDRLRKSNGKNINFSYIKIVEPGIYSYFQELLKWKSEPDYYPNFVCATDSLVLKAEYFLREFCYFLEIPTFKSKDGNIIMERILDNILNNARIKETLTEDDYFFIKFILIEKAGYNLRNRIAHGLMDNIEYGLEYSLLAIIIILKLSNYQFKQIKNS